MATYSDDDLLTTEELAEALRVHARSLRRWRNSKPPQGPPVLWAGEVARYRWGDVVAWLRRRDQPKPPCSG